jgi:hypothetical protein
VQALSRKSELADAETISDSRTIVSRTIKELTKWPIYPLVAPASNVGNCANLPIAAEM